MHVLLSDVLAPWGQAAAIILAIYLFVNILIGLALTAALMFLFAWVRGKAELIKTVRPTVETLNQILVHPESVHPTDKMQERLVQVVEKVRAADVQHKLIDVQHQVEAAGVKVDQGADRVAGALIEFRARTVMVKSMVQSFFLPGLKKLPAARSSPLLPEWATAEDLNGTVRVESGSDEAKQLVGSAHEPRR
ncbi:MAG TPA: hypothetical protein VKT25_11595 [Ktedonobacteraceae bacterium]|nr:hypothetical protein [Ktedonobacteraceae bacterium]